MQRRFPFALSLFLGASIFSGPAPAADALTVQAGHDAVAIVHLEGIEGGISQPPGQVGVLGADGRVRPLTRVEGHLVMAARSESIAPAPVARPGDILDDGEVTTGSADIVRAWLTDPTDRYAHGILGDAVEAGGLALQAHDGTIKRYRLGPGSVFEDRRVRLFDLDGDGRDEAIVVQSYLDEGAALTVFALGAGGVRYVSEVPAIGRANRWLNPLGAADFDGDGVLELAYIETPHIGGTLRLYEFRDGKLRPDGAAGGFSNHAIGSREQEQGAVHDWSGDGVPDIAVPDARRRTVWFVTFADGSFHELDAISHSQPVVTAIRTAILDDSSTVYAVYGLADGTILAVRPEGDR